jgi:[acyl-carrier-protein] S-malonyltransferase
MIKRYAFLFPGQGSQVVGMGEDVYNTNPLAREMYDLAEDILEFPIKGISFKGPEAKLKQSQYTQPAIFTNSLIFDRLLKKKDFYPVATAGHSLGEYSAVVSAGAISFDNALRLVKLRGELMQTAGEKNPGTMAAIMGLSADEIKKLCDEASAEGIVQPGNFNSPGQVVISGSMPGVSRAMELATERGARLVKQLEVSGAFHSPLMEEALEGLSEALEHTEIESTSIPIYSNVEAKPVKRSDEIRDMLKRGLLSPVLWENIIINMRKGGIQHGIEVGPGKVLQGLLKRIDKSFQCFSVNNIETLEQIGE